MGDPGTGAHFYICNFQKPPPGLMHVAIRKSLLTTVFKFLIISKIRLNIVRKEPKKLALRSSNASPENSKKTKQWFSASLQPMLGPTVWRL
jgi:hypothetical protein